MLKDHHGTEHAHEHEPEQSPAVVSSEIPHHIPVGAFVFSVYSAELTISHDGFVIDIGYPRPKHVE